LDLEPAAHPFTVLIHGFGLFLIRERIILKLEHAAGSRRVHALFAIVMGATVLLLTVLHGIEGATWAFAYVELGALIGCSNCDALFFERHDHLWPCKSVS
jgi:hypothetical protein